MSDIKLVHCEICGEWYELDKIEHKNGQVLCEGCGRPKKTKEVKQ